MTRPSKHPKKPAGPKLHAVDSKMIKATGWEPHGPKSDKGTLHVQFSDGVTWEYSDVPEARWKIFQAAPSKGAFFHHQIKNQFDGKKRGS